MSILSTNERTLFPTELVTDVFSKVRGHSSIATLSKQEPLPFNGKEIMVFTMDDEVNLVGENGKKAQGSVNLSPVKMIPLKIEYGFRTSEEFLYASEEAQIDVLKQFNDGFAKKMARGLDIMAIHGMNPRTATVSSLIGDNYLDAGTQVVATTSGSEDSDIDSAIALFDDYDYVDVTGMAMSKAYKTSLSKLEYVVNGESTGQKKFPELRWGNTASSINGLPIDVNSTVSFGSSTDLAIVGDFENYFKYGIAKEILMDVIQFGDPDNTGVDLKGSNQIYIRSEAYIGWAIMDQTAFARIVSASTDSEEKTE